MRSFSHISKKWAKSFLHVCLLTYVFFEAVSRVVLCESTIHSAVTMASQTEETHDADTQRSHVCVLIKGWPLDSLQGCYTGVLGVRSLSVISRAVQPVQQHLCLTLALSTSIPSCPHESLIPSSSMIRSTERPLKERHTGLELR